MDEKQKAQKWFKYLRSGTEWYEIYLKSLRKGLQKGGIRLEKIGSSNVRANLKNSPHLKYASKN